MSLQLSTAGQPPLPYQPKWKVAATLPPASNGKPHIGVAGPAAGLHNEVMLVAGGANFPDGLPWLGGKKSYQKQVFVFAQQADKSLKLIKTAQLAQPLAYPAACSTPNGLLVAGGEGDEGIRKEVLLLQWEPGAKKVNTESLPPLPVGITNGMATSVGQKVFVAGGETKEGVSGAVYMLDFSDIPSGWKQVATLPIAVSHGVLLAGQQGGETQLTLVGGRARQPNGISILYSDVQVLQLHSLQWEQKSPMPSAMAAGTGVMLKNGDIILFGGDTGETFSQAEKLIAAIAVETDEATREKLNKEKIALQTNHPGFNRTVLFYHNQDGHWSQDNTLPFATPVTTCAVAWNGWAYLVSGEIKAGVRTPFIQATPLPVLP